MKTTLLILLIVSGLPLTACRHRPAERIGRRVDNTVDWVGYGVRRTGEKIQRAVR